MRNTSAKIILFTALSLTTVSTFATIKKVTLFVNYGHDAILHSGAIDVFKNTLSDLATTKGFTLTISEQTNTDAKKKAAFDSLKTMDVAIFANIGDLSIPVAYQTLVADYFTKGGKGIGYHASIDHHFYWKWWADLHSGGTFEGHGNGLFKLTQDPEMKTLPALQKMWTDNALGDPNISNTEIYTLTSYPRGHEGVTMMQTAPALPSVPLHDFTWHRQIGLGQYIFTCLGHGPEDFTGGWLQKATWAWMEYLNGKYNPVNLAEKELALKASSVAFSENQLVVRNLKSFSLQVTDINGVTALAKSGQGSQTFDLNGLKSGFYFVRFKEATGGHSFRVLVK